MDYPDSLPVPSIQPYNWTVGLGVVPTKMNAGNQLLRRTFNHLPHQFSFSIDLTTDEMSQFSIFADTVGNDWFNMPGVAMWTATTPDFVGMLLIRFISDIHIASNGYNWYTLTFQAELSPDVFWDTNLGPWIDAGYVYQASSASWIEAGTMPNFSSNWIDAGLVSRPSGGGGELTPPITAP